MAWTAGILQASKSPCVSSCSPPLGTACIGFRQHSPKRLWQFISSYIISLLTNLIDWHMPAFPLWQGMYGLRS